MITDILDHPWVYRAWQAPFVNQKLEPFLAQNSLPVSGRVLELGCGPGTNAFLFPDENYVGIDLSATYLMSARKKFPNKKFLEADVSKSQWISEVGPVDRVFMNSLMHHLSDEQLLDTFRNLGKILPSGARVEFLDMILPDESGIVRKLALLDRGQYVRTKEHWERLLERVGNTESWQEYDLTAFGVSLWRMFYWRGTLKDTWT